MARVRGIKKPHPLGSVASRSGVPQLTAESGFTAADGVKISELPPADAANDIDQLEVNQGGVSRRVTVAQIAARSPGPPLTVTMFGAVGDGETDDTAAFTAAAASGETVIVPVPAVAYMVTDGNITVASNTEFVGLGHQAATIQLGAATFNSLFVVPGAASNVSFRNLHLAGNRATQPSNDPVLATSAAISSAAGSADIVVDGCLIEDFVCDGILLDGVTRAIVSNNTVRNIRRRGGIVCARNAQSTDIQVRDNNISSTGEANIHALVGVNGWTVTGNHCEISGLVTPSDNITGYNAAIAGGRDHVIANNICRNSSNNGIHVGADSVIVTGNIVYHPANSGIAVHRSPNPSPDQSVAGVVSNNDISFVSNANVNAYGIVIRDMTGITISGNIIRSPYIGVTLRSYDANTVTNGSIFGNSITGVGQYGVEFSDEIAKISVDNNVIEGGVQDIRYTFTDGTPDNLLIGANNYSSGATTLLSRLVATSSDGTAAVLPAIKAVGSAAAIDLALVPKGTGAVQANVFSNAAATLTGITIHDTSNASSWSTTAVGAGINFSTGDPGTGDDAGVRLSFGPVMHTAAGNNSNFMWMSAPVTAGTMVPVATMGYEGGLSLSSTVAHPQAVPKFQISGNIDRATWGSAVGILLNVAASTVKDTSSAGGATVVSRFANAFGVPTFDSTNATVTLTAAATLYVAGAPLGTANTTITNAYALYAAGRSYIANLLTAASATAIAGLCLPHGVAPTTPVNGDMWTTTAGVFIRINGVTKTFTTT
jgi:hypothetical protein